MNQTKILIIDDDENIADLIDLYLTKECYDTKIANNGEDGLNYFQTYNPNLVLLDIMLPGIDGYEVLREIRKVSKTPVIMLSAKGETFDKVLGLELGADDYVMKPFDTKELIARIKAVLRRFTPDTPASDSASASSNASELSAECVKIGSLIINQTNYTVQFENTRIEMTPKELELFYFLAAHPNQVFSREQLLDHIWSYDYMGDTRTIDVHIKRLREKFHTYDHPKWDLSTVWGIGYKFETH